MSLQAHHALRGISNKYSDPKWAYRIRKQDLQRNNNVIKTKARCNFVKKVVRLKVGTMEVQQMAASIT